MVKRQVPKTFVLVFLVLLALDQAVKTWVRASFYEGKVLAVPWPGVFELKLTYNEGIAFGMFQGYGVAFAPIAIGIAGAAGYFAFKHPEAKRLHWTLGLLSAGSIGNLIDRLWLGKVTDMFWIRAINFPVFNIADVCLTFAAIFLMVESLLEKKAETPAPVNHSPESTESS